MLWLGPRLARNPGMVVTPRLPGSVRRAVERQSREEEQGDQSYMPKSKLRLLLERSRERQRFATKEDLPVEFPSVIKNIVGLEARNFPNERSKRGAFRRLLIELETNLEDYESECLSRVLQTFSQTFYYDKSLFERISYQLAESQLSVRSITQGINSLYSIKTKLITLNKMGTLDFARLVGPLRQRFFGELEQSSQPSSLNDSVRLIHCLALFGHPGQYDNIVQQLCFTIVEKLSQSKDFRQLFPIPYALSSLLREDVSWNILRKLLALLELHLSSVIISRLRARTLEVLLCYHGFHYFGTNTDFLDKLRKYLDFLLRKSSESLLNDLVNQFNQVHLPSDSISRTYIQDLKQGLP